MFFHREVVFMVVGRNLIGKPFKEIYPGKVFGCRDIPHQKFIQKKDQYYCDPKHIPIQIQFKIRDKTKKDRRFGMSNICLLQTTMYV